MRRISLIVLAVLLLSMVSDVWAGDLKLRYYFNDNLSVGIDKGSAITYWDIKKTEVLGGYTIPLVLWEAPDTNEFWKNYTASLDGGTVTKGEQFDGVLGIGANAPKVVIQYAIDKTISSMFEKDLQIPDWTKLEFLVRSDTERLFNEGEIAGSYGLALGITIPWN